MRHLETRAIGTRGPLVTRLGLGASVIGGLFDPVSEVEAYAVVRRALEAGIRYIDTAPLYGLGASERRVGTVLQAWPTATPTISTKVGRLIREQPDHYEELAEGMWHVPDGVRSVFDFSRDGTRQSLLESLGRLGLDRVDMAFVHDPDAHLDQAIGEALPTLLALRDEGLVGAIGVGTGDTAVLARIVREAEVDCILLAGRYTLLDQSAAADLLPLCQQRGTAVIVGGVLNSGVLADPRPGARFDYREAPGEVVERARKAASICAQHGVPLTAAALQLPLGHPSVVSVLTGVRSVEELKANIDAFDRDLPAALWDDLVEAGVVAPDTPVPVAVAS